MMPELQEQVIPGREGREGGSRKNPRYYKSFAVTPSEDSYQYDQSRIESDVHSKFTGIGGLQ